MSSAVHVKEAVLVTPSEPTPNHVLRLSALDSQLFVRFTFEYLLVYKPRHAIDRAAIAEIAKASLGRALVPYYPLAGRIRERADGLGLEVVCGAQGAGFVEAVSGCTVSEFAVAPTRGGAQWRKFLSLYVEDVLKGAPPVVVQLTWLSDGGATLAVGFNHCICDGIGSGEFLNAFAELATGKCGIGEMKPQPTWSRHLLDPPLPFEWTRSEPTSHPEFTSVPDRCGFTSRYTHERMTPTSIPFDETGITELKKLTKSTCTSFEVLSAHIWRSWARSLRLPSNQIVKLLFSVNIRERANPSLPIGYYGNAFVLGCAQTHVQDLTDRGLEYATELVRRAKERVGDAYVREVVELVSSGGGSVDSVGVLIMTQWSRLGLQRVDFGMGSPVHVGPLCCDKYCILLPVANQRRAVKVNLAVPNTAVDQYLHFLSIPSTG